MTFQNEQTDKTSSSLGKTNWSSIGAMIVLLLLTSFIQRYLTIQLSPETTAKLYFSAIIIGIISIPMSSWLFNKSIKRINYTDPTELNLRIYRVAFYTKLVIVCSGFVVNLVLFFFSKNAHLLIIGAIYIVYQMIAVPSKESLQEILGLNVSEEEADQTL